MSRAQAIARQVSLLRREDAKEEWIPFEGGYDTETPTFQVPAGRVAEAQNWEVGVNAGYWPIKGYERFNGEPSPSDASYARLVYVPLNDGIAVGDVVDGVTSGAQGVAIFIDTTTVRPSLILTKVTGVFSAFELLQVSAVTQGLSLSAGLVRGGLTPKEDAQYLALAANEYRADIDDLVGSGSVVGGFNYKGDTYALRNNAGGTELDLWKATASGWSSVALGRELAFTQGDTEYTPVEGDVITGETSGATATLTRVALESGQWGTQRFITRVWQFDDSGGTYVDMTAEALSVGGSDWDFFPAGSGVDDVCYIGYDETFERVLIDMQRAGAGTYTVTWEYWDNISWTVLEDLVDDTSNFKAGTDDYVVSFNAAGDWTARTINGSKSLFWVRARRDGGTVTTNPRGNEGWLSNVGSTADAAGRFIFASQTGTFQAEDIRVTTAHLSVVTIAGDSSAIALPAGGRLDWIEANFGGDTDTNRIYACNGQGRGWEFDGSVVVPIESGMSGTVLGDKPSHVFEHQKHLFFSFGPSVQHSGIGAPYIWEPIFGANELAMADDVAGFHELSGSEFAGEDRSGGGALGIFCRNTAYVLYGTSNLDWNLIKFRGELGAYEWTIQEAGATLMLDDRGVTSFESAQTFGNFLSATLTRHIKDWINARRTSVKASTIVREKNQYRLYFADKSALYVTMEGEEVKGVMPELLDHVVECAWSVENEDGTEQLFTGDANGRVYQMERGTSFDGVEIETLLKLHPVHFGTPHFLKVFRNGGYLEVFGTGYAEFELGYELGYGEVDIVQPVSSTTVIDLNPARWDSFTWDQFYWDGRRLAPAHIQMEGAAENIALIIRQKSDYFAPLRFSGALLRVSPRRPHR